MTKEELVAAYKLLNPNGVMIEKIKYNLDTRIIIPEEIKEKRTRATPVGVVLKVSEFECGEEDKEAKKKLIPEGTKIHFANAAQTIPGGFEDYPNIQIIHIDDVIGIIP